MGYILGGTQKPVYLEINFFYTKTFINFVSEIIKLMIILIYIVLVVVVSFMLYTFFSIEDAGDFLIPKHDINWHKKCKKFKRIFSKLDPYGEENWEK